MFSADIGYAFLHGTISHVTLDYMQLTVSLDVISFGLYLPCITGNHTVMSMTSCNAVSHSAGCMAALEAEHFLQEHEIQQGKAEPTTAENEALPDNGRAPAELRPV